MKKYHKRFYDFLIALRIHVFNLSPNHSLSNAFHEEKVEDRLSFKKSVNYGNSGKRVCVIFSVDSLVDKVPDRI